MTPFPCPTCTQRMEERFAKTRDPENPAPVLQCQRCWGVFLEERGQEALGISSRDQVQDPGEPSGRSCPRCEREMQLVPLRAKRTFFKKVELDHCSNCHGLYFDSGELQEALGRVASIAESPNDEYLKKNPRRVSSQMGDPAGPWHARNQRYRGVGNNEPFDPIAFLYDLIHGKDD